MTERDRIRAEREKLKQRYGEVFDEISAILFEPVTRRISSLLYDEPKIVKSKAHSAGQVGTFPRDATQLLAILGHPKGASHGAPGVVVPLGHGTAMPCETRLASDAVGRVIVRRTNVTGH